MQIAYGSWQLRSKKLVFRFSAQKRAAQPRFLFCNGVRDARRDFRRVGIGVLSETMAPVPITLPVMIRLPIASFT